MNTIKEIGVNFHHQEFRGWINFSITCQTILIKNLMKAISIFLKYYFFIKECLINLLNGSKHWKLQSIKSSFKFISIGS